MMITKNTWINNIYKKKKAKEDKNLQLQQLHLHGKTNRQILQIKNNTKRHLQHPKKTKNRNSKTNE